MKFDASRLASQAITGIGFLGAGIIVKIAHQQVNGLTTATGLFATVVMGIAAGAGFYECVLVALLMIVVVLNVMSPLEITFKRRLRNITLNVEFMSVDDIATITKVIEGQQARVYDIDIERTERKEETWFFKLGSGIQYAPEYAVELLYNDKNSLDQVLRFCKDNRMAITNLKIQTVSEDVNAKYAAEVSLRGGIAQSALLDQVQRMPGIVSAMGL